MRESSAERIRPRPADSRHGPGAEPDRASPPSPRVLFLIDALRDDGASKMLTTLASGLARSGVAVDLALRRADSPYLASLEPSVRVLRLRTTHPLWGLPRVVGYLRRFRPTAVLLSDRLRTVVAALRARRLAGVKTRLALRVSIHLSRELARLEPSVRERRLRRWRRTLPRLDCIAAVSAGVAQDVAEIGRLPIERIAVLPNPVVAPEVGMLATAPAPHPWLEDASVPVVLGAGRLHPQKDFATLVAAFARVRRHRPCRLIILGEGPERPRLEAAAADHGVADAVSLPGFAANPYAYMSRASLFVLSSRWEGSPNALAEALAVGTPVVSTDCPSGPREILDDGRYGPLVPVGDVVGLADAMEQVLNAPPSPRLLQAAVAEHTVEASVAGYRGLVGLD